MTDSKNERPLTEVEKLALLPVLQELDARIALIIREAKLPVEEYGIDLAAMKIIRNPELDSA